MFQDKIIPFLDANYNARVSLVDFTSVWKLQSKDNLQTYNHISNIWKRQINSI